MYFWSKPCPRSTWCTQLESGQLISFGKRSFWSSFLGEFNGAKMSPKNQIWHKICQNIKISRRVKSSHPKHHHQFIITTTTMDLCVRVWSMGPFGWRLVEPAYTVKHTYTVKIPWSQVILAFYEANKTRFSSAQTGQHTLWYGIRYGLSKKNVPHGLG